MRKEGISLRVNTYIEQNIKMNGQHSTVFARSLVQTSDQRLIILAKAFRFFFQSLRIYAIIIPKLPSKLFKKRFVFIMISLDVKWPKLLALVILPASIPQAMAMPYETFMQAVDGLRYLNMDYCLTKRRVAQSPWYSVFDSWWA